MGKDVICAVVLLLVCMNGISGNVVIVQPVNKTISIFEGSDVVFECQHPPSESVVWYRSGMRILNTTFDADHFIIETDNSRIADGKVIRRLRVTDISRNEGGSYRCSNEDFEKALFEEGQSDEVMVRVIKVGAVIHIKGPANNTVAEGEALLLICSGDITGELVWHFKGAVLNRDPYGHVILTKEENTETSRRRLALTRSKVTPDDEGLYSCYDEVNRKHETILIQVDETVKVVIVRPVNKTITVSEGSEVEFECQHSPSDSVEWFRSGLRILNNTFEHNRFRIQTDGPTKSLLTISKIRRTDAGVYKCSNSNLEKALLRQGQTDVVEIKVMRVNAAPVVVRIEGPANDIVTQGHDLLLLCSGDITSEFIWYFKGNLLKSDLNAQLIITSEENTDTGRKRSALTQQRATADHEGQYNCYDQVNKKHASILIKVAPSDGGISVQYSATLLGMTIFTAAMALAISA